MNCCVSTILPYMYKVLFIIFLHFAQSYPKCSICSKLAYIWWIFHKLLCFIYNKISIHMVLFIISLHIAHTYPKCLICSKTSVHTINFFISSISCRQRTYVCSFFDCKYAGATTTRAKTETIISSLVHSVLVWLNFFAYRQNWWTLWFGIITTTFVSKTK